MTHTAIVLAAGRSSRMGTLKGLLPWQGTTLFEHQLQNLRESVFSDIVVVLGYKAEEFIPIANKYPIKIIMNEQFHEGKCSSIISGVKTAGKSAETILITTVDQPLQSLTINRLAETLVKSGCLIAVPSHQGKRGHPILFSAQLRNDLLSIKEERMGLRYVIQEHEKFLLEVPVENDQIHLNLNNQADYTNALKK
ncbi:molybdenum cofactor cytidylyltransferase [Cytobacillus firmus]|uniref:Molybdenum cofactor cytidylyltransferase n=2 Tax=Cytobacillus TaxID=2675230 RepID=A0A366K3L9_CYTFI|nr:MULTISPECIES: nucleotidyltransferase family protein [Cytobacillus]RBP96264.1 molybdenum cofactor cytidylyltransferase [Cytobacillus firmus]TDX46011.1 molybdenum cofactor cytidylyltransferase [Cytobacillus oceanisediminis]